MAHIGGNLNTFQLILQRRAATSAAASRAAHCHNPHKNAYGMALARPHEVKHVFDRRVKHSKRKRDPADRGNSTQGINRKKSGPVVLPKSLAAIIPKKYIGAHRVGCSPEEVAAWRAARRKNYPTAENIARKEKLLAEKLKRGELVDKSKRRFGNRNKSSLSMLAQYDNRSDDDEKSMPRGRGSKGRRGRHNRFNSRASKSKGPFACKKFLAGSCSAGDKCKFVHDPLKRREIIKRSRKQDFRRRVVNRQRSLLYKLLRPEMTAEHSVMLQCIRYFVQNSFLQKE